MSVELSYFNELVESLQVDFEKFATSGNQAAGTRARKSLMSISKLCKSLRADIQDTKNNG